MMTAKEMIAADNARQSRDGYVRSARVWLSAKRAKEKSAKGFAKADVRNARKANRKLVAALAAGSARPMTVVLNAVMPLMQSHADAALASAAEWVAKARAKVKAAGSVEAAYPVAELTRDERYSRVKLAKRAAERQLQALVRKVMDDAGADSFKAEEVNDARHQFIAYAFKLDTKVGECATATLRTADGVWGESYLYVTATDNVLHCWKTQTIVNRSIYGKRFLQFPTREVNAAK